MSIRSKLTLAISGVLIGVLGVTSLVLVNSTRQRIKSDLIYRDRLIAERIVPTIARNLGEFYSYQFEDFSSLMSQLLGQYPDLEAFRIIAPSGAVLADSEEITAGRYSGPQRLVNDAFIATIVADGSYYQDEVVDARHVSGKSVIRVYAPYVDNLDTYRLMGEFHFSLKPIEEASLQAVLLFVLVASFGLLAGIGASALIASRVTRGITRLTNNASDIREGRLDTEISVDSGDEVGTLASAFREMIRALKKSNEGLSEKVEELEKINQLMVGREIQMSELKKSISALEQKPDGKPTRTEPAA